MNNNLSKWQSRYQQALMEYDDVRQKMLKNQQQYDCVLMPEKGADTICVYNFTKELIESAIDSNIPLPKVEPVIKSDNNIRLARTIEAMLANEIKRIKFDGLNDIDERTTKIMGGDVALVEWNNAIKTHRTVGDLSVRLIEPIRFTPQPGIYDIDRMDYIFLDFEDTKENIKRIYGIDVSAESVDFERADDTTTDETVTQVWVFYKNSKNSIGVYSFIGDIEIIDDEEYFARANQVCSRCGLPKPAGETVCSCGNNKWKSRHIDYEEFEEDIELSDGRIIPAMDYARDENGGYALREVEVPVTEINPLTGEEEQVYEQIFDNMMNVVGDKPATTIENQPYMVPTQIPYYVPKRYPACIRKNVSASGKVFGDSDAEMIAEAQLQANKLITKAIYKTGKNGQILGKLKRTNLNFSNGVTTLEVDSPDELQSIRSIDLSFDVSRDIALIDKLYLYSKSMLGINDSAQGKPDTTATSGRAKEAQIMRAQARQSSKMVMKNEFYQTIYTIMFEYALAYMDEPRNYPYQDEMGDENDLVFNRYDFLQQDEYGNWFYNDQFIITIDPTGSIAENRQTCLEAMQADFSAGLYGNPQDPETILTFWKDRESMNYPNAKRQVARWTAKVEEAKQMQAQIEQQQAQLQAQMQSQQMPQEGVMQNEMPM